jgi:hypothetical protein
MLCMVVSGRRKMREEGRKSVGAIPRRIGAGRPTGSMETAVVPGPAVGFGGALFAGADTTAGVPRRLPPGGLGVGSIPSEAVSGINSPG